MFKYMRKKKLFGPSIYLHVRSRTSYKYNKYAYYLGMEIVFRWNSSELIDR